MAKLIYVNKSKEDSIKAQGGIFSTGWQSSSDEYYNSLVFTNDGHLLCHGVDYSINTTYKLSLNGSTNGDSTNGVNLGTLYAPTTAGTSGQILQSTAGTPNWVSLITDLSGTVTNNNIPSALAVQSYINTKVTSLLHWQSNSISQTPTSDLVVGNAWRVGTAFELPAANSITGAVQSLEVGDVLICTDATTPKFTALQTNWTTQSGSSILDWNTEQTLGTVGGLAIKAKLPVDPLTRLTYTATITNNTTGYYTIGTLKKDDSNFATLYGAIPSFFVGENAAKADAAVSNGTDIYFTLKSPSAGANDNGTNLLGFHAGTGISIVASNSKLITITNTGVTAVTASVANNVTGVYKIAELTVNGSTTSLYGHDINTWRDIKIYKIVSNEQDSTIDELVSTSAGTNPLKFSNNFSINASNEIDLVWEEIDANGNKTYHV